MPELKLDEAMTKGVMHGNPVRVNDAPGMPDDYREAGGIRIKASSGELLAVGSFFAEKNIIKMDVVFV